MDIVRYQPKEKPKYIYCPLEPKCVNSVIGVGEGFFLGGGCCSVIGTSLFATKNLVTSAGFGWNMHHTFETEQ